MSIGMDCNYSNGGRSQRMSIIGCMEVLIACFPLIFLLFQRCERKTGCQRHILFCNMALRCYPQLTWLLLIGVSALDIFKKIINKKKVN